MAGRRVDGKALRRPRARASGPTSLLCGVYNNFELDYVQ